MGAVGLAGAVPDGDESVADLAEMVGLGVLLEAGDAFFTRLGAEDVGAADLHPHLLEDPALAGFRRVARRARPLAQGRALQQERRTQADQADADLL